MSTSQEIWGHKSESSIFVFRSLGEENNYSGFSRNIISPLSTGSVGETPSFSLICT